MKKLAISACLSVILTLTIVASARAFQLVEHDVKFSNEDGSPATLAGSHPFSQATSIAFETAPGKEYDLPAGALKDLSVSLPPGFVGNTTVVQPCTNVDFAETKCPASSAVGTSLTELFAPGELHPATVYELPPSPGSAARLGFLTIGTPLIIDLKVSPEPPYNVIATLHNTSNAVPVYRSVVTIEGQPAGATGPFLTLPRACGTPEASVFRADSWEDPSVLTAPEASLTSFSADHCNELGFAPEAAATGTSPAGEAPSGLDFDLSVDDPGLTNPAPARADSDIERAIVELPVGFTTDPSVANGLGACSLGQYEAEGLEFNPKVGCPDNSKVGTVEVTTPLLSDHLTGQIYVAKQRANKFNSLLALYMIIRDEERGILVKQPINVVPDPLTGQLTTTVSEIPQLPFSDFHLHFFGGQRAPLITPPTCAAYQVGADLYPYAEGVAPVHDTATLSVTSSCAASSAALPNSPGFSAGTTNPKAGNYSPFVLNLSRPDGSQQLSQIKTTLPGGLLGKLAGIAYCPESGIAQAASRGGEGEGVAELAQPSCPAASQVGTVTATAGAGTEPLIVAGKAYLAGPYKGAPLSLEIITPAIAGPFDLGVVSVRAALQVNPLTSQITAESDPIPTILHGLPLDLRSISIDMDRQGFTLNPTSCEPKAITGQATSTFGAVAPLSQYFQASDCAALKFRPKLAISLKGSTKRTGHPALKAVLTYPKGGAYTNIGRAQVNLPRSEFIEQGNLNKTCTKPVLLEGKCPRSTIYGKAKAWTPLLDKPLEGNVYLVGGFGFKLPALVAELDGQIRVLLAGKVDSGPNHGIRNTFEAVPDAPVEKFELNLKGGPKYSLLVNSENLCKRPQKAIARFTAQDGKVLTARPVIANQCGNGTRKGKKERQRKNAHPHREAGAP
jgi:hypothetical protein